MWSMGELLDSKPSSDEIFYNFSWKKYCYRMFWEYAECSSSSNILAK